MVRSAGRMAALPGWPMTPSGSAVTRIRLAVGFARKSLGRRWWQTDGAQRRLLERAQSYSAGAHIARVLGGG
eukprot:5028248-Alexandrium_andersonii.AAC.1